MTVAYRHLMGIGTPRSCEDAVHYYKSVADKCTLPSLLRRFSSLNTSNCLLPIRSPRRPIPPPQHDPSCRRSRRRVWLRSLILHRRSKSQTLLRKRRVLAEHRRCPRVPTLHGGEGGYRRPIQSCTGVLRRKQDDSAEFSTGVVLFWGCSETALGQGW